MQEFHLDIKRHVSGGVSDLSKDLEEATRHKNPGLLAPGLGAPSLLLGLVWCVCVPPLMTANYPRSPGSKVYHPAKPSTAPSACRKPRSHPWESLLSVGA